MKKPQAAARGGKMKVKKKKKSKINWMWVAIIVPTAIILLPTTVLLVVGLLPAIVAAFTERDPEPYKAITIGAPNLCGVLPFALDMWTGVHSLNVAIGFISNGLNIIQMWWPAVIGWGVYLIIPPAVVSVMSLRNELDIKHLRQRQQELLDEWGRAVMFEDTQDDDEDGDDDEPSETAVADTILMEKGALERT